MGWDALGELHFLRPLWLGLLPLFPLLAWSVRRATRRPTRTDAVMAPHLARALELGAPARRRFRPVDGVSLIGALAAGAAAGPTWSRVANPLASDSPPMVIAFEVSQTMLAVDAEPARLERARFKIRDLPELRACARTALVAYAGTAHRVLPATEDPQILETFVEPLAPGVMPRDGEDASAALRLARETLGREKRPGVVLFVSDGFDAADLPAFRKNVQSGGPPVLALILGSEAGGPLRAEAGGFVSDAAGRRVVDRLDTGVLSRFERQAGVRVVRASKDRSDLRRIARLSRSLTDRSGSRNGPNEWEDRGWIPM